MWGKEDEIGLGGIDDLLECDAITIRRVGLEQIVFDYEDFGDVFGG